MLFYQIVEHIVLECENKFLCNDHLHLKQLKMPTPFWNPARFPGLASAAAATVTLTNIASTCLGVCNHDTESKYVIGARQQAAAVWVGPQSLQH